MRPRDKCSTHFGAVPAGYDPEPERLFCFDVTRRKILHELHEVLSGERSIFHRTLGEASGCSANNHWFSSRWRAGQSPQVRAATRSRWWLSAGASPAAYKVKT